MSILNFFKCLTSTSTHRPPIRRRPVISQLQIEPLEDRCLPSFSMPVNYSSELAAQSVVSGDFNGDGRLDLATANRDENTVSVLLGNGDGTFQGARTSGTGIGPQTLVAGDLNGDGKADLVTRIHPHNMSLLLANGDGTFQPPQTITLPAQTPQGSPEQGPLEQNPVSVAVGDFNGDGKPDIVAGGQTVYFITIGDYDLEWHVDNYANVLLGNGDGTFSPAIVKHLAGGYPLLRPGDFNNDGRLDVVLSGGSALGNGDGTLQDFVQSSVYVGDESQPVEDFNGDGKLDVLSDTQPGPILQRGNGDGTFQQGKSIDLSGVWHSTVVGDVNADGKLDIVVIQNLQESSYDEYGNPYISAITHSARVLLGNGDGSFAQPIIVDFGTVAGQDSYTSPVLADFDGDGFPDLAATEAFTPSDGGPVVYQGVHVALNDGNWTTPPVQASSLTVSGLPSPTTAGVAGSFTVTAKNADGSIVTGYTGTVHFTSSDGQAGRPADYTFTAADGGVHTFSATLKTAGTQSITAADATTFGLTGTDGSITVNAAAASTMTVSGFRSTTTAGVAGNFTVTLKDPYGNIATGYVGTVHFSSSDAKAVLSANYTFTAVDHGTHTFSATLKTAGIALITVTDITTGSLTGTDGGITVNAAAASQFIISAPSKVTAGSAFSLTITVEDAYGNVVTGYTGTIHFTSTDKTATLPANYTFTASDKGVHTFTGLVLRKKGTQRITITDTLNSSLTSSVIENVL